MSHFPKKLIDMSAVLQRVPLCRASVYSMIANGEFPAPVNSAALPARAPPRRFRRAGLHAHATRGAALIGAGLHWRRIGSGWRLFDGRRRFARSSLTAPIPTCGDQS
jgi:hypothetical protein